MRLLAVAETSTQTLRTGVPISVLSRWLMAAAGAGVAATMADLPWALIFYRGQPAPQSPLPSVDGYQVLGLDRAGSAVAIVEDRLFLRASVTASGGLIGAWRREAAPECPNLDDVSHYAPAVADWLRTGDRGASSEALLAHLLGAMPTGMPKVDPTSHPHGPADFRRCVQFLEAAGPAVQQRLPEMAHVSAVWGRLIPAWDELMTLYREEREQDSAPRLFRRLQDLTATATA